MDNAQRIEVIAHAARDIGKAYVIRRIASCP